MIRFFLHSQGFKAAVILAAFCCTPALAWAESDTWQQHGLLPDIWASAPDVGGIFPYQSPTAITFDTRAGEWLIIKNDRYWFQDTSGRWTRSGYLKDLWKNVPAASGVKPYYDVSGLYCANKAICVIANKRYWLQNSDYEWVAKGMVTDVWASAPVAGDIKPSYFGGPTAMAFEPDLNRFVIINRDTFWHLEPGANRWFESGKLSEIWNDAPEEQGSLPTTRVSALYAYNGTLCIVRGNKYWLTTSTQIYADKDKDGLPDRWEHRYFSSLQADPLADDDADGINNRLEYDNRTHPMQK